MFRVAQSPPSSPAASPPFSPYRSAQLRYLLDNGLQPLHASDHFFHVPKVTPEVAVGIDVA